MKADEFLRKFDFYGMYRYYTDQERDEIAAALRRPLLEPVPTPRAEELPLLRQSLYRLEAAAHGVYLPADPSKDEWDELRLAAELAREVLKRSPMNKCR